ncbi:MAG: acyl carrier protein [Kiritimatiellae bacterium]|nr:acyl carrier protein [Kiritimatiellia bacterium]
MNDFLAKVADVLEVESVAPETDFRQVEGWCSLKAFGLLVMLDQEYGKQIGIDEFLQFRTVSDLARAAGVAS